MRHRIHAFLKPTALVLLAGHLAFGADAPRNLAVREPVRMAEPPSKSPTPVSDESNQQSIQKSSSEKEKIHKNQYIKEEKSKLDEVKVKIYEVDIAGNTVFTTPEILIAIEEKIGSELTFSGLTEIAETVTRLYQRAGYPFARAILPPQTLSSGRLKIEVVEGRYGEAKAFGPDERLVSAISKYLAKIKTGELIRSSDLERLTGLWDELPGIEVSPSMKPGASAGLGDLVAEVKKAEKTTFFELAADNHGSRYTGYNRLRSNLSLLSPLAVGDKFDASVAHTDESLTTGNISYSFPIGINGLRIDMNAARSDYSIGKEYQNLNMDGKADILGANLGVPLLRSKSANASLSIGYQHKDLRDHINGFVKNKESHLIPLTLSLDLRDRVTSPSVTSIRAGYSFGRISLDQNARIDDTIQSEGQFNKATLSLLHQAKIAKEAEFVGRLAAQTATRRNLDASEDFTLGGPAGVRAYPVGEATGDKGYTVQLQVKKTFGEFTPYVFYDTGRVETNVRGESVTKSRSGAGVGIEYKNGPLFLDTSFGWRSNRDVAPESDPTDRNPRAWVTFGYRY